MGRVNVSASRSLFPGSRLSTALANAFTSHVVLQLSLPVPGMLKPDLPAHADALPCIEISRPALTPWVHHSQKDPLRCGYSRGRHHVTGPRGRFPPSQVLAGTAAAVS